MFPFYERTCMVDVETVDKEKNMLAIGASGAEITGIEIMEKSPASVVTRA